MLIFTRMGNKKQDLSNEMNEKTLSEVIIFPKDIEYSFSNGVLALRKGNNKVERKIQSLIKIKIEENKIILSAKKNRRLEKRLLGSIKSHIINLIKGFEEGFIYKLQVVNVHFPMTVSYNKDKNELIVRNFLGERKDRIIKLVDDVDVRINKDIIELESCDIEKAGQAATRIELGTKVSSKDRRVFQDGIFIIEKPGRIYL